MKNFFKKLSFVLAVAMVLTSIAPATASAAAKNYIYQSGKDSALTSVSVWFGDKATDLNVKINGKKNVAGTWKVGNTKIATVDKNGVITPVANGTTTVKFTAKTGEAVKATVVVGTRVKTVKPYLADDAEKKALTELALNIGEQKEIKIGLGVSSTAAKAGAKTTSMVTAAKVDGTAVEVVKGAGQRSFTVKAVAAGEATVTIGAHKTTALVQAGKFFKSAEVKVTVADKLAAKQTGANKITVTGSNLSDTLSDYVVKRGTVTLSLKSVTVNEAKTEAVLTAASSNMPKGEYTLSFKGGDPVAFTVEEAVVAKIVINPENAIMTSTTTAVAYYKVFNQFDEDVTDGTLGSYVNASGSDNATINRAKKQVTFTNSNGYTMNVSQVSLALVCTKNGINVSKILTVTEESKLSTVEFAGVRKQNADGVWVETSLKEGLASGDLNGTYYLFFKGIDQYGLEYPANEIRSSEVDNKKPNLQINLSSVTGLTVGTTSEAKYNSADFTTYAAYPLDVASGFTNGKIANGTVTLLGVVLTSGKTVSATFDVVPAKKVATLTIAEKNGVYGNQANELYFEALSESGEAITDYETLSALNSKLSPAYNGTTGACFERKADGSAKLVYYAATNTSTIAVPEVITCLTQTNAFTSANVNIQPNCVATAIIGISPMKALAGTSGTTLTLGKSDFTFEDQYGNVLDSYGTVVANASINIVDVSNKLTETFPGATSGTSLSVTCATPGSATLKVTLKDGQNKDIAGSDYTFSIHSVDINKVSNITVADFDLLKPGDNIAGELAGGNSTKSPMVTGTYAGLKVTLQPSEYQVVTSATAPAINKDKEGIITKEATAIIVIKNNAGTEISKTYKYSNADPVATTVSAYHPFASNSFYHNNLVGEVTTGTAVGVVSMAAVGVFPVTPGVLSVSDQYGDVYTEKPRVTISNYPTDATLSNNGTKIASISFKTVGYKVIHVKYVWDNGTTFETDMTVKVK